MSAVQESKMDLYHKWVGKFFSAPVEPMKEVISKVFIVCASADLNTGLEIPTKEESADWFMYQVIDKRAKFVGLDMTHPLTSFLSALCDRPGMAVMYVYALRSAYQGRPMTMEDFSKLLPMGFPDEKTLSALWDDQKVECSNLLDSISAVDFN